MSDKRSHVRGSDEGAWPTDIEASQRWLCTRFGAAFDPISGRSLVAIDPLILDPSINVEGSRYQMTGAMSGWILIGEQFNGGVADLRIEHASHVADARPDLVRYFALPVGWRFFRTSDGENVYLIESTSDTDEGEMMPGQSGSGSEG
jgi:hypothetical protein